MYTFSISKTTRVGAPCSEVWKHLSQLDQVSKWAVGIETSRYSSDAREGIGVERTCEFSVMGIGTVNEKVDEWEPEKSLGYVVTGVPVFNYVRSDWHLQEAGDETILTWKIKYEARFGFIGRLLERLLKSRFEKEVTVGLASFKYYVEHGQTVITKNTPLSLAAVS